MKKIGKLCLCLVMIIGICNITCVNAEGNNDGVDVIKNDASGIPDAALYKLVLEAGDADHDGILTKQEALHITTLGSEYASSGVADLTGLDLLTNLSVLALRGGQLSDLTVLNNMINLTSLNLSHNQIKDVSPIANLTDLTYLNIGSNQIIDISDLSNLVNLEQLWIQNNKIKDITALSEMNQLSTINSGWNEIEDIGPLANLTRLNYLRFEHNNIKDLSALEYLTDLVDINFASNHITDIASLKNLTKLTDLDLGSNAVTDISSLAELSLLEYLDLSNDPWALTHVQSIDPLEQLDALKWLSLSYHKIKDISALSNLSNLEILDLSDNEISDISPLAENINLNELYISYNKINDISALRNCTALEIINLDNNSISNIDSLKELQSLTALYLNTNHISDISALSNLINLHTLYLQYNEIRELPNLTKLVNLDGYYTVFKPAFESFHSNYITEQEFKDKMPPHLANDSKWILANRYMLPSCDNLKAIPTGTNETMLYWDLKHSDADGYSVYRRIGVNGAYQYLGVSKNEIQKVNGEDKFVYYDRTASNAENNYYRVYPYKIKDGKETRGTSTNYAYAKGIVVGTSGIQLNAEKRIITVGKVSQLKATVLPNGANQKVTWRTGNPKTATVDQTGKVTAKSVGLTWLYAKTVDGKEAKALIKVIPQPTEVKLNYSSKVVTLGKTTQFKAAVNPTDANQAVTWRSSNSNIASVDQTGKVTAKRIGTAYIYAKAINGKEAKAVVKVIPQPMDVKLNYSSKVVTLGKTTQFKATVNPTGANQAVTWRSDNPKVASIDQNGMVRARAVGNATIYAQTVNGKEIKAAVKVIPQPKAVKLNSEKQEIKQGATYTFKATVNPTNANQAVTWRIGNTKIAKVDKSGKVTALSEGLTWLYAKTVNGLEVRALVKVIKK